MKRNKYVILSKILNMCIRAASKTRLVYRANLNFRTASPFQNVISMAYVIGLSQSASIYQIHNALDDQKVAVLPASVYN